MNESHTLNEDFYEKVSATIYQDGYHMINSGLPQNIVRGLQDKILNKPDFEFSPSSADR